MLTLIATCDSHAHFDAAIGEYTKRLGTTVKIEILKPEKSTDIQKIIRAESERLMKKLTGLKGAIILLDERGESLNTLQFNNRVNKYEGLYGNVTLIVGGAYGVDRELLKEKITCEMRLSELVMPHSLALLVLLEQLYRIGQIRKGSGYHHT